MINYYSKTKNLMNDLINGVGKLENETLSEQIFKIRNIRNKCNFLNIIKDF